jgi:hypothetical protein
VIDGYIKIRMSSLEEDHANGAHMRLQRFRSRRHEIMISPDDGGPVGAGIPFLPPNFSTGMKLDRTDEKLWSFRTHLGVRSTSLMFPLLIDV